eukprot:1160610-Pelagomonas_calceolata.AAC.17
MDATPKGSLAGDLSYALTTNRERQIPLCCTVILPNSMSSLLQICIVSSSLSTRKLNHRKTSNLERGALNLLPVVAAVLSCTSMSNQKFYGHIGAKFEDMS